MLYFGVLKEQFTNKNFKNMKRELFEISIKADYKGKTFEASQLCKTLKNKDQVEVSLVKHFYSEIEQDIIEEGLDLRAFGRFNTKKAPTGCEAKRFEWEDEQMFKVKKTERFECKKIEVETYFKKGIEWISRNGWGSPFNQIINE